MKHTHKTLFCLLSLLSPILTARSAQTSNMFDAAIAQIDTQSKELNQQVMSGQQEGLANQKIQRLELELTNIKAEYARELEALKTMHEDEIKTLKTQIANAQQSQAGQSTALTIAKKDLEDAHQEIAQLKTEIDGLKGKIAPLEEQIKEYDALKSRMAEAQEKTNTLTMPASLDIHKTE